MGHRKYTLHRQAQKFIDLDEQSLRTLANQPRTEEAYIFKAREEIAQQEKLLEEDLHSRERIQDKHWDSGPMRILAEEQEQQT